MVYVDFKCYKISMKLPLDKIEKFFDLNKSHLWRGFTILDKKQVDTILKYNTESKTAYLFMFGCICFVNFREDEIYTFLKYIDSIIEGMDYNLFSKYNESHIEPIDDIKSASVITSYIYIICIILSKSVELSKLEADLEGLLDRMDKLINFLNLGKFHIDKKLVLTISKILRLEYHYANNIKIFDRSIYVNESAVTKTAFDRLSRYYELDERLKVIQNKMEDMRNIISAYSCFSFRQREARAYWFEVILLALFPLAYLVELLLLHN